MFWQGASYLTKVTPKTGSVLPDEGYSKNTHTIRYLRYYCISDWSTWIMCYVFYFIPEEHNLIFQIEAPE
jgi:hypothetical protein